MDQRDWELLVSTNAGVYYTWRSNRVMGLTVAVVFLVGLVLGGIMFNHKSAPVQLAWTNLGCDVLPSWVPTNHKPIGKDPKSC